jgi:cell division protein FtsI/penicillin-binding protein 2
MLAGKSGIEIKRAPSGSVMHEADMLLSGPRGAFHDPRTWRRATGGWRVAGKTGTLNGADPFIAYSWFVGFAPAHRPEVAFAVLLGHGEGGGTKAAEVAREVVARWQARPR